MTGTLLGLFALCFVGCACPDTQMEPVVEPTNAATTCPPNTPQTTECKTHTKASHR